MQQLKKKSLTPSPDLPFGEFISIKFTPPPIFGPTPPAPNGLPPGPPGPPPPGNRPSICCCCCCMCICCCCCWLGCMPDGGPPSGPSEEGVRGPWLARLFPPRCCILSGSNRGATKSVSKRRHRNTTTNNWFVKGAYSEEHQVDYWDVVVVVADSKVYCDLVRNFRPS